MKKMKFKRAISLFLTMILTVSQFMNVGVEVKADEQTEGTWIATEYITNGDFETGDTSGWSIDFTSCDNGTSYTVKTDEWASNNKTSFLSYYNVTDGNVLTIAQTISEVPAGIYRLSFEQEGKELSSGLSVSVADVSMTLPATTGWDVWADITTDAFTIEEAGDVTITISGTVPAEYWGDFDNFVLEQFVADENKTVEELELEVLDAAFEGSLWEDGIWTVTPTTWDNTEFTYFTYADNTWLVTGENQGTTSFKFWSQDAQEVTLLQEVDIPAGTYKVNSDFMGEKGSVQVVFGDQQGTAVAMNGWNSWVEINDTFTVTEDMKDATIGFKLALEAGGYGYIDSISVTEVAEEEKVDEKTDENVFTASDDNYTVKVTVDNVTPENGDTIGMSAKITTVDGSEVTDLEAAGMKLWWWTDIWMTGHEDGLNDASYTKDDEGYGLEASVTLPSVGTYYIVAELEYSGAKLQVVVPMITTKSEDDTPVTGEINVEKIKNLPEDFIMGMDISSVMSEFASGVTYKDFEGNTIDNITDFCKFLAENGITHIRVRVWNDPYDANGNGYGGGNCDVATAAEIAEGCRAAGLKMLIDFHCSDFWADPGKQQVPKAWSGYTLEQKADAVEEFIGASLRTIDPNHETIDMVQVGNETTGSFVGESGAENMCKLFSAGAKAIRAYNEEVKVVIHVTNPEKGRVTTWAKNLDTYAVDYDVLATSYYPYWHGTLANLQSELAAVKANYGKDTMVAETSYAYTLEDSDGHSNTVRVGNNDSGANTLQPFSVQGQATAIRNVMETVNNAGGLGVFYWEPAWITVGDITGLSGDELETQIAANKEAWETYGSGWAASYGGEYNPEDAGKWYGGSAVDNEAMFYPDGTPTAGLYVWNYVKTGAVSRYVSVESVTNPEETIDANAAFTLPETVVVTYNSGEMDETVAWNEEEVAAIDTAVSGVYTVSGTVTFSKEINQGAFSGMTSAEVIYTLTVKQPNLVTDANDAGFESGVNYTIGGKGISAIPAKDDPYEGKGSMHWYYTSATTGTVTYNKVITLEPGKYSAELMSQGFAGDTISLQILSDDDEVLFEGDATVLEGWAVWKKVAVDFMITKQTDVKIQIVVNMQKGGWGTADALYLYKAGDLEAKDTTVVKSVENADGTTSFELTNEAAEGISLVGSAEIFETAKFDAEILNTESEEYLTVIDKVKEIGAVELKENTAVVVLKINLWDGKQQIHEGFGEVTVTIDLPEELKDAKAVEVFRVEEDALIPCNAKIVNGKLEFITNHFSTFLVKEKDVTTDKKPENSETGNDNLNSDADAKEQVANVPATLISSNVTAAEILENTAEIEETAVGKIVVEETMQNTDEAAKEEKVPDTENVIAEEEVPLAVNAGGSIPMWAVLAAVLVFAVFAVFAGVYVYAKQNKIVK